MFGDKIINQFNSHREDDTFTFVNEFVFPITLGVMASDWVYNSTLADGLNLKDQQDTIKDTKQRNNYNELINDKEINPKNIKGIRYIFNGTSKLAPLQFKNPFKWIKQDASGKFKAFVDYPVSLIRLDQYQQTIVDIYYNDLIIGLKEFMFVKLEPEYSVTMTFIYDDFKLSNLIKEKTRNVLYSKADIDKFEYLL
jgi:hypothetical protein